MTRKGAHRVGRRGAILTAAAAVLAVFGIVALVIAFTAQVSPPQPPRSAAHPAAERPVSTASPTASPTPTAKRSTGPSAGGSSSDSTEARPAITPHGPILGRSVPVHLTVPAISVDTPLLRLGLNPDHSVQVPKFEPKSKAGWYEYSPTPGQLGPSVILGHIDSAKYGKGVFFDLGDLRPGNKIYVKRRDGTVAVFKVTSVEEYSKHHFPTLRVYGNIDHAGLRLITCGGKFNFAKRSYEDNIVAYADLVSAYG